MKVWELQKAIHNAASGNIVRKSGNRRDPAVRWWTPTLTDLKRMSYNARRDYQNSDQPPQERHERCKPITPYGGFTPMPSKPPKKKAGGTL